MRETILGRGQYTTHFQHGYLCDMVRFDDSLNRAKQAGFATVGFSNEHRNPPLMCLVLTIQQTQEIDAKDRFSSVWGCFSRFLQKILPRSSPSLRCMERKHAVSPRLFGRRKLHRLQRYFLPETQTPSTAYLDEIVINLDLTDGLAGWIAEDVHHLLSQFDQLGF